MVRLSKQQKRVVELLATGLSRSEIGDVLGVSKHTIAWHIRNLHNICGVSSSNYMCVLLFKAGLIDIKHTIEDYAPKVVPNLRLGERASISTSSKDSRHFIPKVKTDSCRV